MQTGNPAAPGAPPAWVQDTLEALASARGFITNGIELGYVARPDDDDPAALTLPLLEKALGLRDKLLQAATAEERADKAEAALRTAIADVDSLVRRNADLTHLVAALVAGSGASVTTYMLRLLQEPPQPAPGSPPRPRG